jgi:CMP-N-acetylneuraminic acid synthetase
MRERIAMIPARMGSQRLKQKNLAELGGITLLARAIRKCLEAAVFDQVWVNSEHEAFREIAEAEGALFHHRPLHLGDNSATSEAFVREFLEHHECDTLFQVHTIAPLLNVEDVRTFVAAMQRGEFDSLLSYEPIQIECALDGKPINFTLSQKTNSQDLVPVQRITWSITAWRRAAFLSAAGRGECATYAGRLGFHPVNRLAAHLIKTAEDLAFAEAILACGIQTT